MYLLYIMKKLILFIAIIFIFDLSFGQGHKVTICHVPPGNPANAHTITISANAWPAHQAHGDQLGACGSISQGNNQDLGGHHGQDHGQVHGHGHGHSPYQPQCSINHQPSTHPFGWSPVRGDIYHHPPTPLPRPHRPLPGVPGILIRIPPLFPYPIIPRVRPCAPRPIRVYTCR